MMTVMVTQKTQKNVLKEQKKHSAKNMFLNQYQARASVLDITGCMTGREHEVHERTCYSNNNQ